MPQTVLDWLIARYPTAKRQTLRRMVEQRRVILNGEPVTTVKHSIDDGDELRVDERPKREEKPAPALPFPIVYEDADVLVIDKPAGLLTSTVPREPRPTALALVRTYLAKREPQARVGLIHRLDRDASGLLVFSKNDQAYQSLKRQFFRHTVDRVYLAVVREKLNPRAGRIESRLVELPDGTVRSSRRPDSGERAISDYQVIRTERGLSLVRVTLQTGRKHQIRVHLSERGAPIVGDPVYAPNDEAHSAPRLLLAAVELAFDHPRTTKRCNFKIAAPDEIKARFRD
jgi:23S rRNA pseudouridine1911/1915/1917 synthase